MKNKILKDSVLKENSSEYKKLMFMYNSALKELNTKIDVISDEFKTLYRYNPIEHVKTRIKSYDSIKEKVKRKGYQMDANVIVNNLSDIAGIRIVCSFVPDVYRIVDVINSRSDINVIESIDYIENPKKSGYQSYHMVVLVPVYLSGITVNVKVEIQIRTIAMDFWASLEHKIKYKFDGEVPKNVSRELIDCAKSVRKLDRKMANLGKDTIEGLNESMQVVYKELMDNNNALYMLETNN